jgi:hypothetical protein
MKRKRLGIIVLILTVVSALIFITACPTDPSETATEILSFVFAAADNDAIDADVTATIDGADISVSVPNDTDITGLVPTITISDGASVSPASGTAQDFSSPVTYTVTAADGETTAEYTVTVGVAGPEDTTAPSDVSLTVTQAGAGRITLEWEEPADEDYDHLLLSIDPADADSAVADKGTTTYQFTGLTDDTEYTVTGKSVDEAGNVSSGSSVTLTLPVDEMEVISISTAAELAAIDDTPEGLNDYYILTADIDLEGVEWIPIANDTDPFVGVLEGNGHTLFNLTITSDTDGRAGLFGTIGVGAAVRNLQIENFDIAFPSSPPRFVGALIGKSNGLVQGCSASGTISTGVNAPDWHAVGGLVGESDVDGEIRDCSTAVSVSVEDIGVGHAVGGLVGRTDGVVSGCSVTGDVTGIEDVGGLAGAVYSEDPSVGRVENSSADVIVSGSRRVGGLIGWFNGPDDGPDGVQNCNTTGTVHGVDDGTGIENVGGLIGDLEPTTVIGCHSSCTVNAADGLNVGGLIGRAFSGTELTNCYATGNVEGSTMVGGLIGDYTGSDIGSVTRCYATGNVDAGFTAGGLIAFAEKCQISESYAAGNVTTTGGFNGGLVGGLFDESIENSFATGSVTDTNNSNNVGGLVGGVDNGSVINCYSVGAVSTAGSDKGGLVGDNDSGTVTDSFYDQTTSGMNDDTGKGKPKTTAEMTDVATFTNTATAGLENAWDFVGDPNDDGGNDDWWDIDAAINDGYPYLEYFE